VVTLLLQHAHQRRKASRVSKELYQTERPYVAQEPENILLDQLDGTSSKARGTASRWISLLPLPQHSLHQQCLMPAVPVQQVIRQKNIPGQA